MKKKLCTKFLKMLFRACLLSIPLWTFSSQIYGKGLEILDTSESMQQVVTITGMVTDKDNFPLTGVTVAVKGTTIGVATDIDGKYTIKSVDANATLVFTFIGMTPVEVEVKAQREINVVMLEDAKKLEEVVVVAFGTQKKESLISSIETINPKELKVPSSNLTTALAGRLAGVIAYQRSGEPGMDNADFFIRGVTTFGYKKDPLILIDGIESTTSALARLQPDDIDAFSILKDATATALYGARGANGVIQVKTKEGAEGPIKVSLRYESSFSSNTQNLEFVDPITYMQKANEAVLTRNPNAPLEYSYQKIDRTIAGINPYVYPANDWKKMLLKDVAQNQRVNLNLSGGGGIARYYIAATFNKDNGNLKMDKKNNFNNNIDLKNYQLRSNINIDLTKTTEAIVRFTGDFVDYRGALSGGKEIYELIMKTNPVMYPAYYPTHLQPDTKHILFGNATRGSSTGIGTSADYINPYAEMVKGYKDYATSRIDAQLEVKQDLNFITRGLKARLMLNTSRYSFFDVKRYYKPYFYAVSSYDRATDEYTISNVNESANPTEYLGYNEGGKDINSTIYIETALSYDRTFNQVHQIGGLLVYQQREELKANQGTLMKSLAYRNQGLSGRFTYGYDSRYFAEFNFGYNGSERFYKSERFGFFPAIGAGWVLSNEAFMESLQPYISKIKLKGTYGMIGNDAIGEEGDRFFYLSDMNMNDGNKSYTFGENFEYSRNGISVIRYDNRKITWEKAYKTNIGLEIGLMKNDIDFQIDYFSEKRENILMNRNLAPSMGLAANVRANVGEAKSNGIDMSLDYNKMLPKNYWIQARGNFTYAHSEYVTYEEPTYKEQYRTHVGQPIGQVYGLIAERLFIDEQDVANSPLQTFSEYGAGDIKYYDANKDGQITEADMVPIGFPKVPEIIYGFGFSLGNDRFDFSAFFQGSARSSFWINSLETTPFAWDHALIKAYAEDHWSEDNRNPYALWPRLSTYAIDNNNKTSTWFMRNGAFLRLKTVEIGYKIPEKLLRSVGVNSVRLYATGNNMLLFSGFKLWDIEMGGDGLGYPIQRVFNVGIQVNL